MQSSVVWCGVVWCEQIGSERLSAFNESMVKHFTQNEESTRNHIIGSLIEVVFRYFR
jgi:hypothetical protein